MFDHATWGLAWLGAPATLGLAIAVLLAGVVLGAIFFGGLWWTVQRVATSPRPVPWLLGSLVLRTAIVIAGIYLVSAGRPVPLALCLLGFVLARAIVLRATRPRRGATAVATALAASRGSPCA